MDDQLKKLQARGLKITPQRKLILDILTEAPHLSGEEIAGKAREVQPHISLGTVYRNLNTLCEIGLVKRIESIDGARRFEINAVHHHHMVCLGCRDTLEIEICPINEEVKNLAQANGFDIADHEFEIQGYCSRCTKGGLNPKVR